MTVRRLIHLAMSQSEDADEGEEDEDDDSFVSDERSSSPLAGKNATRGKTSNSLPSRQSLSSNNSDEYAEEGVTQSNIFQNQALPTPPNSQAFEEEEMENLTPLPLHKAKAKATSSRRSSRTTRTSSTSLAGVVQKTAAMTLDEDEEDAAVIIPNKKAHQGAGPDAEYVPQAGESDTGKKKKR